MGPRPHAITYTSNPHLTFKVRPFHVLVLKSGMGYQLVSKTYSDVLLKNIYVRTKLIEILETEKFFVLLNI